MTRTFPLGRFFGIRLDVHASWFVIYAFVTITLAEAAPLGSFGRLESYALAAVAALGLFASVVVHEFAHALTARRFGVTTRSIALFMFGGVATLESEPPGPAADALVALAGPLVSAVVAALAYGAMLLAGRSGATSAAVLTSLLAYLTVANAVLAGFNLIPAYPMDGGRVLRALLWRLRGNRDTATGSAALVGLAFAGCFAVAGVVGIAATRTWQFGWYIVVAGFLMRQCWSQYRALPRTPRRAVPAIAAAEAAA